MIPSVENSRRISILNQSEINELYEIPKFTDDERGWYFELHNSGSSPTKVLKVQQFFGNRIYYRGLRDI